MDRRERLLGLLADASATSMQVLYVRQARLSFEAGDHSPKVSRTVFTDHVGHNLALGGRELKTPLRSRHTNGCCPTQKPSMGLSVDDSADLWRLIVLYWAPLSNKEAK